METLSHGLFPMEIWRYRELLRSFVVRNLKIKYQRSALGFLWTLLNPAITIVVLVGIFTYIVRLDVENYWAFLLSGYFVWNFTAQSLGGASVLLPEHAPLRLSVPFPPEVLILSAAATRLVEFGIELALVLIALAAFHHGGIPASFAILPVLVILQVILVIGLVMPVATLAVFYSDIQHALPPALLTLFYISPVFYPVQFVPEPLRAVYFLNPLAPLLTLFHVSLYEGRLPSLSLFGVTAAFACAACVGGYAIFRRYRNYFAEIL